jgi:hypothetical protein
MFPFRSLYTRTDVHSTELRVGSVVVALSSILDENRYKITQINENRFTGKMK